MAANLIPPLSCLLVAAKRTNTSCWLSPCEIRVHTSYVNAVQHAGGMTCMYTQLGASHD